MQLEAIYAALFDRLKCIDGLMKVGRRLKLWTDTHTSEMPALFLAQGNQIATPGDPIRGLPTKWTLEAEVYIYVSTANDEDSPATPLNILLDEVRCALRPDYPEIEPVQKLGGLVERCWIEGTVEFFEGALSDQAVAIIPVRMLAID